MRRDVLVALREREDQLRVDLERVRDHLQNLRTRSNATTGDGPYRSEGEKASRAEIEGALAEEDRLLRERESLRQGFAEAGIHTSLPRLTVVEASACATRWSEMSGDSRTRICSSCRERVHDVNGLSTDEIDALLVGAKGKLWRRADGMLLLRDCPKGVARTRTILFAIAGAVALFGIVAMLSARERNKAITATIYPPPSFPSVALSSSPAPSASFSPLIAVDEGKLIPEERAYIEAALVHPDRQKRLEAARALIKVQAWSLWMTYDREDLVALRNEIDPKKAGISRDDAYLDGALLLGDIELLRDVTTSAKGYENKSWMRQLVRLGAFRCLFGDKAGGMAFLRTADKVARQDSPPFEPQDKVHPARVEERGEAHIAAIACGSPFEPASSDPSLVYERDALRALGFEPPKDRRWDSGDELEELVAAAPKLTTVADIQALNEKANSHMAVRFLTPEVVLSGAWGRREHALAIALDAVESAAVRVASLAGPEAKRAAHVLWLAAASERIRRGDRDGARKDADRAELLATPDQIPLTVPIRLLLGDVEAAGTFTESAWVRSGWSIADALQLRLYRVLVSQASGKWNDAFDRARELHDAVMNNADRTKRQPWRDDWVAIATWTRIALARRAGKQETFPIADRIASKVRPWMLEPWASEADRRAFRLSESHYHMTQIDMEPPAVMGTILYVAGEVAAGQGDIDVWLDGLQRMLPPARFLFADRAVAARLRGDETAAKMWDDRSARIATLIHDDATAVLASLAGY